MNTYIVDATESEDLKDNYIQFYKETIEFGYPLEQWKKEGLRWMKLKKL